MSYSYSVNDISYEACAVEKEHERISNLKKQAVEIFRLDFRYEFRWLHGDKPMPTMVRNKSDKKDDYSNDRPSTFKKLRNELVKICHPDLQSNSEDDGTEFKEIQKAFETGNYTKLVEAAQRYNVDIRLSEQDVDMLKETIARQKEFIKQTTSSVEWAWFNCNRNNMSRKLAWKDMKVDGKVFKSWLENNGSSLKALEAEALARYLRNLNRKKTDKASKKSRRSKSIRLITA